MCSTLPRASPTNKNRDNMVSTAFSQYPGCKVNNTRTGNLCNFNCDGSVQQHWLINVYLKWWVSHDYRLITFQLIRTKSCGFFSYSCASSQGNVSWHWFLSAGFGHSWQINWTENWVSCWLLLFMTNFLWSSFCSWWFRCRVTSRLCCTSPRILLLLSSW